MSAQNYGRYYWCVKTTLLGKGKMYLFADEARILQDGTLVFVQIKENGQEIFTLSFAACNWDLFYAASVIDNHPVCVEHWEKEVEHWEGKKE